MSEEEDKDTKRKVREERHKHASSDSSRRRESSDQREKDQGRRERDSHSHQSSSTPGAHASTRTNDSRKSKSSGKRLDKSDRSDKSGRKLDSDRSNRHSSSRSPVRSRRHHADGGRDEKASYRNRDRAVAPGAQATTNDDRATRKKVDGSSPTRDSGSHKMRHDEKASYRSKDRAVTPGAQASNSDDRGTRKKADASSPTRNTGSENKRRDDEKASYRNKDRAVAPGAQSSTKEDKIKKTDESLLSRNEKKTDHIVDPNEMDGVVPNNDEPEIHAMVVEEEEEEIQVDEAATIRRRKEEEARARKTMEDQRRMMEEVREEEGRRVEELEKGIKRRNCIIWVLVILVIIVGSLAIYFGAKGDDNSGQLTNSVATPGATPNPTETAPTVNLTDSPSSVPTVLIYTPPSEEDCQRLSERLPPLNEELMFTRNFDVPLDIGFASIDTDPVDVIPELEEKIRLYLIPRIVGCPSTAQRRLGMMTGHRTRQLRNTKYMIADANVRITAADKEACVAESSPKCSVVSASLTVKLRGDESDFDVILLLEAYFEKDKDLSDDLKLSSLMNSCVRRMDIIPSSNYSPTLVPTKDPSVSETLWPTLNTTASPTIVSGTSSPSYASSTSPTQTPSISPTKAPTKVPTPDFTPEPTRSPSKYPSFVPTVVASWSPSTSPSKQPSSAPSSIPSFAPTSKPSESPSAAPSSERDALEAILSRFAPFDGDKERALDWLLTDTWEPPSTVSEAVHIPLLEERFALAVFFYATNGDGGTWFATTGWLTSTSVCTWNGITACNGDGLVTKFALTRNLLSFGLTGDFPDELRALRNLEYIEFEYNKDMRGNIPSFLTALTKLTYLGLNDTGRTGSIPSELWTMTQLKQLQLGGNYLTGSIPNGISTMTELRTFYLPFNDLTGSLPDDIGGMTRLTDFRVHENFLTGAVPPLPSTITLCRLASEVESYTHFSDRKREGNCFTDITNSPGRCWVTHNQCWLEATLLRFSPFDGNKRLALDWLKADTWTPPSNAADKTALWEERFALAVFYYATTGDNWSNNAGWLTSADVCTWTGIIGCNADGSVTGFEFLSNNRLVGDIPDELRALQNLEHFNLRYNRNLSGRIPSFLPELTKLTYLNLGDTGRVGSIPSELWTLTQLEFLAFWGNYLTGTIPSGLSVMTELGGFQFQFNELSGSLPTELGALTLLTLLKVDENYLTGTIPALPRSLTACSLAIETNSQHFASRKTEGNCFTNPSSAPSVCGLGANC